MSNSVIALLVAISVGTWVYTKMLRRTGGNTKNALIVAGLVAVFAFIIVFTIALSIDKSLS